MKRKVVKKKGVKTLIHKKQKPLKERLEEQYKDEQGLQKENLIEKKVRTFLEESGIYFVQEKAIRHRKKTRFYDFYVTNGRNYSFLIETDGEWFHPQEYSKSLHKIQKHNIKNDKLKNNIAKAKGIPLIRLREHDIKYNFNYVKSQILNEINRQKGVEE